MSRITKTVAALGVVAGLGVATLPLSTYAATTDTKSVDLEVQVLDNISITVGTAKVTISAVNGSAVDGQTGTSILTVGTSNSKGYTLKAKTGNVNLTSGSNAIPAGVPTTGQSKWGIKGGDQSNYIGLTTADQTIKTTTSAPTDNSDAVEITFGVTTASSQAAGTYTGNATFTAVANLN